MKNQIPKIQIFNVPISKMDASETVMWLEQRLLAREPVQVVTINPIILMNTKRHEPLYQACKQAELVVPDGTGVVWAAKYRNHPVNGRVPGIDLMRELLRLAQEHGWRVYFVGASPEGLTAALANIQQAYPRLTICGHRDGYFTAADEPVVNAEITQSQPDLVFVGRSMDKQETWISENRNSWGARLTMGVGGSFDIWSGQLRRAPAWMQQLHVEWLYRLLQEPRRTARMADLPRFVWQIVKDSKAVQDGQQEHKRETE